MLKFIALLSALAVTGSFAQSTGQNTANAKVLCYYDSSSFVREGLGKFTIEDLDAVASLCTHVVYGYAGIQTATNKLASLKESQDLDQGKAHFRTLTSLKAKFPQLKVILSVGGNKDENKENYLTLLETSAARVAFVNSAYTLINTYKFDGLDLAWQFPPNKPEKIRSSFGSVWSKFKKTIGIESGPVDEKSEEHREQFTSFVRELKNAFRHEGFSLSLTVLPNVNASTFFDVPAIINNLDYINIAGYDFQTPDRNPKKADFPSPIYELNDRKPGENINSNVQFWLSQNVPATKIIIGFATYGRSWKMTADSGITGVPPIIETDGPGPAGPNSRIEGLLSYPEICAKLVNPSNKNLKGEDAPLRKVGDPTKRFGSYAYRVPDGDGNFGMWVAYEDPDTAGNKAAYVKNKGLGGIALFDMSFDDFRGTCTGDKFPILRAAKYRL